MNIVGLALGILTLALSSPIASNGHWDKPYFAVAVPTIAFFVWVMFRDPRKNAGRAG